MIEIPLHWWKCVCGVYNPTCHTKCTSCGHDKASRQVAIKVGCDSESALHDEIEAFLRARRWPYVHSRMDQKSTTALGVADFVILAPDRKTIVIEVKTRTGKQTPEQIGWQMGCERNDHKYHIVRNFEQFKDVLEGELLI